MGITKQAHAGGARENWGNGARAKKREKREKRETKKTMRMTITNAHGFMDAIKNIRGNIEGT